jgi:[ribosomal protein S5]-alanine N-acetyltransferase
MRADYPEFAELMTASEPCFREFLPKFKGRRQFNDYLGRCKREDFFGFLICRKADGLLVGNINLFNLFRRNLQSATVGYFVGAPHVRQGYATEALQLLLRFAFRKMNLHRVEANIQPGNLPSIALVKRAGFSNEGLSPRYLKIRGKWRDHERWGLLAEKWRLAIGARNLDGLP